MSFDFTSITTVFQSYDADGRAIKIGCVQCTPVYSPTGDLTRKSEVLGSIPGLATYFRFSFRWFKRDSCQLLAKVCARSTG